MTKNLCYGCGKEIAKGKYCSKKCQKEYYSVSIIIGTGMLSRPYYNSGRVL